MGFKLVSASEGDGSGKVENSSLGMGGAMSMLFFDVFDGERHVKDEFGVQLDDRSEVPEQAMATAHSLLTDGAPGHGSRLVVVSVRNKEGQIIYTASASSIGSWTEMLQ